MLQETQDFKKVNDADFEISNFKGSNFSLEDLINQGSFVIFDASAIISPIRMGIEVINKEIFIEKLQILNGKKNAFDKRDWKIYFKLKSLNKKISFYKRNNEFLSRMGKYIEEDKNLFATPSIIEEICGTRKYKYKPLIKNQKPLGKSFLSNIHENNLLRREIYYNEKKLRRIGNSFIENKKVILFDELELGSLYPEIFGSLGETDSNERIILPSLSVKGWNFLDPKLKAVYNNLYSRYENLKDKYGFCQNDYDLLVKGLTLSEEGNAVIIVSNDSAFFRFGRKSLLEDQSFSNTNLRIFKRHSFFDFKEIYFF